MLDTIFEIREVDSDTPATTLGIAKAIRFTLDWFCLEKFWEETPGKT